MKLSREMDGVLLIWTAIQSKKQKNHNSLTSIFIPESIIILPQKTEEWLRIII